MRENPVKAALKAGKTVVGAGLGVAANPLVVKILAQAGYDFLFVDTEHNMIAPDTLVHVVQMARSCGISPIVRPTDAEYHLIANALDTGADGLIVPRVETAEQARRLVSYTKYPPVGVRGCGGSHTIDYQVLNWSEVVPWLNEQTLIATQVESVRALDALDEMVQVPGVDAIIVGPTDLSISLGVPGQNNDPKMVAAIERVIATCNAHGKPCGIVLASGDAVAPWVKRGMRFVVAGSDSSMLLQMGMRNVQAVRAAAGH